MTEAQIQLQNALTTTFLANLVFLSEYDNDLYQRVDELSKMIEQGHYKEKYALEFNMKDGDFDIYDIVNDKYLYNKSPKRINESLINEVDFDSKQSIFEIPPHFMEKIDSKVEYEKRFEVEKINDMNKLTLKDVQEYTKTTNDYLEGIEKKRFKKIDKFIFLGTLLGRHIPKIAQKVDATVYLVLERNLEIFRLSLFTVDYTILGKNGVIFSIMDDIKSEEEKINKFLMINIIDNYLLKLSTTNINIERYLDNILSLIQTLNPVVFDYNRHLYTSINRSSIKLQKKYKFLNFSQIKNVSTIFKDKPILYIAGGPSLDENIDWIKINQDNFFIVCIGRVITKLIENNIKIDIIITLDEQAFLANSQFNDETVKKLNKNIILFASSITNEKILNKFDKKNIYIYEVYDSFFVNNISFDGFSVGEVGLDILLKFNPKEIYLVGLDFSINQITGLTHSIDNRAKKINLNQKYDRSKFEFKKSLIQVAGNFKEEVYTTPLFYSSIKSLEEKLEIKDDTIKVYNLSRDGAKFVKTIPQEIIEIKIENFTNNKNILEDIKRFLDNNFYEILNKESKNKLIREIDFLNSVGNDFLNNLEIKNNINFDEFIKIIEEFLINLYKNELYSLNKVLYLYLRLHLPYLKYYFNDRNIKAERNKLKKIKLIFLKQIKNIFEDYKICLERLI